MKKNPLDSIKKEKPDPIDNHPQQERVERETNKL